MEKKLTKKTANEVKNAKLTKKKITKTTTTTKMIVHDGCESVNKDTRPALI